MSIVVGSVVYKQSMKYIDDFLNSLKSQTKQNFDVILVNDDIEENDFFRSFNSYIQYFGSRLKVMKTKTNVNKPYLCRIELLKIVKEHGYTFLILCDCDDVCALNRIEMCPISHESERWFFYNEFLDFNNEKIMPSLPLITEDIRQVKEYNYLGLSNTMLVMKYISDEFINSLEEGDTKTFDWYLYSRILLEGGTGEKIENTYTYYRIYQENVAGVPIGTLIDLKKEIQIKKEHYLLLKKYNPMFEELLQKYTNLNLDDYNERMDTISYWWGKLK